jgi:hypothetical protein
VGGAIFSVLFLSLDRFWTEIFIRAVTLTPYRQSGNWIAVVVSVALFLTQQLLRWRRAKWKIRFVRAAWKAYLYETVLSAFIVGTGLFFYSLRLEIGKTNMDAQNISAPKTHPPQPPSFAWDSSPKATVKPAKLYAV